ncbi:MAG: T9SS type A sorting domain-containing protein [Paludibacteraceae bacterium]
MKTKSYIITCGTILINTYMSSQVYTPNGSLVLDTEVRSEQLTSYDIAYMMQFMASLYPDATVIGNPTSTYNCHAYAWHMSESNATPVWMGVTTNPTPIYWNDGSYDETTERNNGLKVSYDNPPYDGSGMDNHSAITTSEEGVFISKWGAYPLIKHAKDYTPYTYSALHYYKKNISPRISGPTTICTQAKYTIENLPAGATVVWSASNNYITLVWANNETAVFQKNGVWNSSILATIYINGTQLTLSPFEIVVDRPVMTILDSSSPNVQVEHPECCATAYLSGYYDEAYVDLAIVGLDNLSISNFDVENNNSIFSVHRDSRGVSIVSRTNQGSGCFKIHPKNECGYGQPISACVEIGTDGYFSLTPNPASSVVTLRLTKADTKSPKNIVSRKSNRYEIQLRSTFGLIKTIQTDQSEVQIPINGLAKGVYYVHVIRSGNVEKKKLIVE